ncbi:MAG: UDP-N-acetylmuramoyl-L-alanyl-D-glutamate--2,6-diaminopimelate ligase [Ignavibacteriota bacterium]|nr:UDP-N-acetylmuramoyl-L-alanyl-D-glutamate--2,6-diaminopimelate ligase [Ignavibacteriota bacterium]
MKLTELLNIAQIRFQESVTDFEVKGLSLNSKDVKPGFIFFSIRGMKTDGKKFAKDAASAGAELIIADTNFKDDYKEFQHAVFVENVRQAMAEISCAYYDNPSDKLKVVGITGTNGKTTISYIVKSILESNGHKCGLVGTIDYITGSHKSDAKLTTPDSIEMNQMLNEMVNNGLDFCVMEVSSIALVNSRVHTIKFDTAVFTNLTSEHMDLHLNMENYLEAKKILFDILPENSLAISNSDDEYGIRILDSSKGEKKLYSINNQSDLKAENIKIGLNGLSFDVKINGITHTVISSLTGRFNVYNILAAIECCLTYEIGIDTILSAISKFEAVKGRFNRTMLPNGACAIVDYSHTSDSLKNAIEAAIDVRNSEGVNGKVITLFGCGGDKDKTKRPVMGKIATDLSDFVIISSDNPRTEDPMSIINDIEKGIDANKKYEVEADRDKAIMRSIEFSKKGDIILICGKGHETYQEINGVKSHFDDQEVIQKYSNLAK